VTPEVPIPKMTETDACVSFLNHDLAEISDWSLTRFLQHVHRQELQHLPSHIVETQSVHWVIVDQLEGLKPYY